MAANSPGQSGIGQEKQVHVDLDLLLQMENVFSVDDSVIAAFEVFKLKKATDYTGTQLLKALGAKTFLAGRSAPEPRIVCLTVKRGKGDVAFKPFFHLCKASDATSSGYKVSKSYPLHQVSELTLPAAKPHHQLNGQKLKVLEVRIPGGLAAYAPQQPPAAASAPDVSVQLGIQEEGQLMMIVALLLQLLRKNAFQVPKLVGLGQDDVDKWWASNQQEVLEALGDFAAEVMAGSSVQDPSAASAATAVLMSAKEEKDLEELLDMYAMGYGDVAEFEARLQEEHDALEEANVQSVLSSVPLVDSVLFQMRKIQGMLDDMDENLVVLDAKLRHMREDIAAIETSNNNLELQSRNNTRLLQTLEEIISDLKISKDIETVLEDPHFDNDKPAGSIVKAAWALHAQLQRLTSGSPTCIHEHLLRMRVVRDAREQLGLMASRFVARAMGHISDQLNRAVDDHAADASKKSDRAAKLQSPDHARIRAVCKRHRELVRVLKQLDPPCMAKLQQVYSQAVNMLIRKELKVASTELRKAAQLDMHNNPMDYSLAKDSAAAKAAGIAGSMLGSDDVVSVMSDVHRASKGPASVQSKSTVTTMTSIRMVPMARGGAFDGVSLAVPLNEAYQTLLDAFIPFLLGEAEAAASFLLLYQEEASAKETAKDKGPGKTARSKSRRSQPSEENAGQGGEQQEQRLGPEGPAFMAGLLQGIETEFQVLVELAAKGHHHQVLCLPMLADTTRWLSQLALRPIAAVMARTLAACHERLRTSLAAFVSHQVSAVEAYASKANAGVKTLHVLAFTSQFAIMTHHIEIMLAEKAADGQGMQQGPSSHAFDAGQGDEDDETWARVVTGASWSVRAEVDKVYQQLVGQMFGTLEHMAGLDPKHGQRLRLENYTYFAESLRPLVSVAAALAPFLTQAEDRQEESMQAYVQQQLEWGRFWKLLEFSNKVHKLLEVGGLSPAEVCYQPGCSAAEVKALVPATMKEADKKLQKMFARVRKHLGTTNLAFRVWERIEEQLLLRYERLEDQLADCYTGLLSLPLSPDGLAALVKAAAGSS